MQVLRGVLTDQEDSETELYVLNCNRNYEDILMREELDELEQQYGKLGRLKMYHTLTKPNEDWKHGRGRIDPEMLRQRLPAPAESTIICLCGPEPMQETVKSGLKTLGFDLDSSLVVF